MITKADIVLAVVLLALGLGSPFLLHRDAGEKSSVIITVDGEVISEHDLSENRVIAVTEKGAEDLGWEDGHAKEPLPEGEILNLIVVENGTARVTQASCSGQDCVRMGTISREGQVIACLPHKLLVSIGGSSGSGPDVIIK